MTEARSMILVLMRGLDLPFAAPEDVEVDLQSQIKNVLNDS